MKKLVGIALVGLLASAAVGCGPAAGSGDTKSTAPKAGDPAAPGATPPAAGDPAAPATPPPATP